MSIVFENFEDVKDVDLNRICQAEVDLMPRFGFGDNQMSMAEGSRHGSSAIPRSSEEISPSRSSKGAKRKSKYVNLREYEKLRYGVVLNKMRKILTVRQEYVIDNRTLLDYSIRISHCHEPNIYRDYPLKAGTQFGLLSQYYKTNFISIKLLSKPKLGEASLLSEEVYSTPILIEDLVKA